MNRLFFKILRKVVNVLQLGCQQGAELEKDAAYAQGKGWGGGTIQDEVSACLNLLSGVPRVFVDIGGNKGHYTQEVLRRFPDIEVFLFEPASANIPVLKAAFSSLANVYLSSLALSDISGQQILYADRPGSELASLSKRRLDHFGINMDCAEQIEAQRFDAFWTSTRRGGVIDYVKMDVEGHELSVLRGFGALLPTVRLIQFEFGGCNIDSRTFFQDFWYFFAENDFSIYRITPSGVAKIDSYVESDEFFSTTYYIALNNRSL